MTTFELNESVFYALRAIQLAEDLGYPEEVILTSQKLPSVALPY